MFLVTSDLKRIQPNVLVEKIFVEIYLDSWLSRHFILYYNTFIIVLLQALQLDTQVKSTILPETWPVPVVHAERESGF